MGLSPKLAYTTDQEVHQIRKLVCEIPPRQQKTASFCSKPPGLQLATQARRGEQTHTPTLHTRHRTISTHAPPLSLLTRRPTHAHHRAHPRAPRHGPPPPARTPAHARHTPTRRTPLTTPHTRQPAHTRREEPCAPRHANPNQWPAHAPRTHPRRPRPTPSAP